MAELRFDMDAHVNEPPHVWQKRVPVRFRDRAPKLVDLENGDQGWSIDGGKPSRLEQAGLAQLALQAGGMVQVSAETAAEEMHSKPHRFENFRPGNYSPKERLEDMAILPTVSPTAG